MGDVPDFVDEDESDVWEGGGTAYKIEKVVGNGAFGIVWKARAVDTGEVVAIKKVLLDRRYQNRELQMMKVMDHDCVIRLKHFYEKQGRKKEETFLQLVMEFLPDTLRSVTLRYQKKRKRFPVEHIKVYVLQMLKAMEYIHSRRICHRDIKPDNLLVDSNTLRLKLCDFGCSKVLVKGQPNISYICSRYYRAPELLFGATEYSCALDMWSIGTILAELLLGHLPFQGQDSTQQHLVEIMKLLGTPSNHDLQAMGASCTADDLPKLKPFPWDRVFPPGTPPDAIDLVSRLLMYNPETRLNAQQALAHPFLEGVTVAGIAGAGSDSLMSPAAAPGAAAAAVGAHVSAWVEEYSTKQRDFDANLVGGLEQSILAGVQIACGHDGRAPTQVAEPVFAAIMVAVQKDLKTAAAALEQQKAATIASVQQLQGRLVQVTAADGGGGGAGSAALPPEADAEAVRAERDRLQAASVTLTKELEEAKAAHAQMVEQLRVAQAKIETLEAEHAMDKVAIDERSRGQLMSVGIQTEDDLMTEPRPADKLAEHGRRGTGRSYMSGFFTNNGIVPSPLLKRPSSVHSPMQRGSVERAEGGGIESQQAIMDSSQNLGQVRPNGALSPGSNHTSPRPTAKWGLGRASQDRTGAANAETSQPIAEEVMPNRRIFRRSLNDEK